MRGFSITLVMVLIGMSSFGQQAGITGMSKKEAIKMASLPQLKIPEGHSLKSLPTSKDNTTTEHFPNVFNQTGWSCNQASSVGYLFTYEMNAIRNLSASSNENLYPPSYVWNFLNQGSGDNGVSYFDSWEVIRTNGIPSVQDYGEYPGPQSWKSGYDVYYQGMKNRTDEVFNLFVGDPEGLNTLKHWINDHMDGSPDGGVANFQIGSGGMKAMPIPAGLPEEGRYIMTRFNTIVGHAMTFVGWNDSVRYDFNNDGKFTNDIDINGDDIVDMRDWEIGAMLAINSWGQNWPAEFERGRVFVPYYMLATDSDDGGIWDRSVTVMRPKEQYSPKLAIKASVSYSKRNQIKIIAGVAQNFAAAEPEVVLEFPFFNFLGGSLPMKGYEGDGSETLEFGLDITPLLNYIDPNMPAKFFLEVYHKEGAEFNGSGQIDYMSIMDYGSGTVIEEISTESNIAIRQREVVRMAVIYNPVADPVNITTSNIPEAEVGVGYSTLLSADGGTPPYVWSNSADEYVAEVKNELWEFPFPIAEKVLGISDTSRQVVDLFFDFPFYGKNYSQITLLKGGGIIMGPNPKDYPYVIDPSVYIFQNAGIYPFYTDLQYMFGTDGVYRLDEGDGVTIAWDATLTRNNGVYDPKFGVKLFKDGRIESGYVVTAIQADWNWIAGVSAGDMRTHTLPEINNAPIFYGGIKINYNMNTWPSWLYFSQGGAMLGVPEDGVSRIFLPVKVTDDAGLYNNRTFNLQINGTSGTDNIQAPNNIEIFPNPFTDRLSLRLGNITSGKLLFDLYSVDGKMVYSKEFSANGSHLEVDLSELQNRGSYFYQIKAGEKYYRGKLVKSN